MKKIVIVGGSKGIGKALVNILLDEHQVINLSRTEPQISHVNLTHHELDVLTDELPQIDEIDALIYCPGSINLKPISRLKPEDFKADFEINVLGAVRVVQQYLDALKRSSSPSILMFSTVAVKLGMPFHSSIAVAKAGVEGLVKSLAAELAPTIRVNAIAPTVTDTDLASKLLRNGRMKENITERHPLKKYLDPKEVASMANFLLSENAASLTGQVFQLDCGIVSLKL